MCRKIQPSALSPQPSALSPQPSALSTQHSALSRCFQKFFCAASTIFLVFALATPSLKAEYSYVEPISTNYWISQSAWAGGNFSSFEAACQAVVNGYNNIAGSTYEGRVGILEVFSNAAFCYMDRRLVGGEWVLVTSYITRGPEGSIRTPQPDAIINFSYVCPANYTYSYDVKKCRGEFVPQKVLTLTPAPNQKDPRPLKAEGKDGKSTLDLIATVTENGNLKAGVAVTFAVEPIANSGGHDHHDDSRPKGLVNGALTANVVTNGNGEIKVTFQADQVAGTHVVSAVCDSCTNKSVTKNVDVKVPDLVSLQAGSGYTLEGNTSSVGVNHKGNHYFTKDALFNLQKLIFHFNSFGWQPVGINDSSLVWGGKFDSKGFWTTGFHDEHRIGEEVDIGFITGTNASKMTIGYYEVCRDKKIEIPSTILWHDIPISQGGKYAPHFHVRLSGTYTKGPAAGKYAKCDSDSKTK